MIIWDVLLSTVVVMSGVSVELIGDTNSYRIASTSQNMTNEQLVEWTAFSQYESGQTVMSTVQERGVYYQLTVHRRVQGGVGGIELNVENESTGATDSFFVFAK